MKRMNHILSAAVLCTALFMQTVMLTGCGSKKEEAAKRTLPLEITSDMVWYDASVTEIESDINPADYEYSSTSVLGTIGDKVIFQTMGYLLSSPTSMGSGDTRQYIHVYDTDGNYLYDKDIRQAILEYDPGITNMFIHDLTIKDDQIRIEVMNVTTEAEPYLYKHLYMYFDVDECSVVSDEEVIMEGENANYTSELDHFRADGWNVTEYVTSLPDGSRPDYSFDLVSPQGTVTHIDLVESLPMMSVADVMGYLYLGDGRFIFQVMNFSFEDRYVYVNVPSLEVAELSTVADLTWLYELDGLDGFNYYDGFGNASVSADGINILNLDEQKVEQYISFDNCSINRFDSQYLGVVSATPERIILAGTCYREYTDENAVGVENEKITPLMVVLDRAESNPNAGKKVIALGCLDSLSYPVAEAVRRFNETSSDTFIMLDPRYRYDDVAQTVPFEDDMDQETYDLRVRAVMMNNLSLDLMAGEGPDLIFGAIDYRQLNSPDVLLDLSSDVNIPNIYTNVMESSRTNGALYQVPLSFTLEGIIADAADVPEGQPGFDFESYNEYVSGPCNGKDPNRMTRLTFMSTCLAEMSSVFAQDSGYNYDNAEFASLAEFVNGQILPDELEEEVLLEVWFPGMEDPYATDYVTVTSGLGLLALTQGQLEDRVIMGFPSNEPRGLMINVRQSIGVSAATNYEAQCRRFVELLVSDDMQTLFASYEGIAVNRRSEETACIEFAQRHNDRYNALTEYYTVQDLVNYEYALCEADPDELSSRIDYYVENAAGLRVTDAAVEIIVREEIQAYFAGQKSIDEVMDIIQERVNTYVNERGR